MTLNQDSIEKLFAGASQCHQEGNWQAAEHGYHQVLAANPKHSDALHRLGVLAAQLGQAQTAVELIRQAIEIAPETAEYHTNLGLALVASDQFDQAVLANFLALKLYPDCADTHFNLGVVYERQGKFDAAALSYEQAIRLRPAFVEALINLGNIRKSQGRLDAAVQCFHDSISFDPSSAEAHYNLASVLHLQLRYDEAFAAYRKAIELRPNFVTAYNNLGTLFAEQGRYEEAVDCYQKAVALDPNYFDGYFNLGVALNALGKSGPAAVAFQKTIELYPEHVEAHYFQGCLLKEQRQHEAAIQAYRRALALRPGFGEVDMLNQMQQICQWSGQGEISQRLVRQVESDREEDLRLRISPLAFLGLPIATTASQQFRCAQRWAKAIRVKHSDVPAPSSNSDPRGSNRRLRIGYLSADFRMHPVGYLIPEWIESHDRKRFEIFGYSLGQDDGSDARRRLVNAFDHFVEIQRLSFADAARVIKNDGIDILVDLQGYTQQARTQILAHRPSPIQVNYLGYAGTMGAEFIDYILVDDFVVPVDQQPFFSEQIIHVPGCFMVNDSHREIASCMPLRRDVGLPEEGLVLCAFSTSYKITEKMFDAWCRLLQSIDNSVLWLRSDNLVATNNLRHAAEVRGIASDRIVFAPTVSMPDHLARHRLADLFLDTFPYNQHSSASDAIRMGIPLVTLAGETFVSRVAGSLLRAVGLSDLVTQSFEQYEALVQRLANHPEELSKLRQRLANNLLQTDLFDGKLFAKKTEHVYLTMHDTHRKAGSIR